MKSPNTLTYERWLELYAAAAAALTFHSAAAVADRLGAATSAHAYRLDLSSGSYAVHAHDWSRQLTPARWFDAMRSGKRDAAGAVWAAWELVDAQ